MANEITIISEENNVIVGDDERSITIDSVENNITVLGNANSTSFSALTDTPNIYTSQALKLVRVKSGEDGLEFIEPETVKDINWGEITGSISAQTDLNLQSVTDNGATTTNSITVGGLNINNAFQFPTTDGTNSQVLKTDGTGTLTWQDESGGGGGGSSTSVFSETPTGLINSSNTIYTFSQDFISGTTRIYLNGLRQELGTDYTETGTDEITFTTAPTTGDVLFAEYNISVDSAAVFNETPSGNINGANTVFTTVDLYVSGTTRVHLNGLRQELGTDYTESGASEITFSSAPLTNDIILIDYRR